MIKKLLDNLKINPKLIKNIDFSIVVLVVIIAMFGIVNIYSAIGVKYALLQLAWLFLGLAVLYFGLLFDYNQILNFSPLIYWVAIALLGFTTFFAKAVNGASGWISLGNRALQPGEFAKIAMILIVAKTLEECEGDINNIKNFAVIAFYAAVPMVLLLIQPDMGLTMVSFFIMLGIVVISNLDWRIIVGGILTVIVAVFIMWNFDLMQPHWKARFESFVNPEKYELSSGMQVIQSKIAIGSGQITGLGFGKGVQYKRVPENHTDFIFAVIGEEWGMVGASVLLILYGFLIFKIINIAKTSKDLPGSIISIGIAMSIMFSVIQNAGMAVGLMPITGITLPFVSYGGSSMLTNFISLALVLNISMRRNKINF